MIFKRTSLLTVLLFVCCFACIAQRPGPQFRRPLLCEPFEPRTKLEALERRYERVVTKGFTRIVNLSVRGVTLRLDAVELKENTSPAVAKGLVFSMITQGESTMES